jgi:hypothetical protein
MRHPLIVACLVAAVIGVVVLRLSRGSAPHPGSGHATTILGVEALIEHVEGLTGPVRVKAIVGQVLPGGHLSSLVDLSGREELLATGQTQCVTLPVRWSRQMPAPRDVIVVEGAVEESDAERVFAATQVSPLE